VLLDSSKYIDEINQRLKEGISTIKSKEFKKFYKKVYKERAAYLRNAFVGKEYLADSKLNNLVRSLLEKICQANGIQNPVSHLLISRSMEVNARYSGEGTMIINLGLINKCTTKEELAFTIGHELAHHFLGHSYKALQETAELFYGKTIKEEIGKTIRLGNGEESLEQQLELLKKQVYTQSRYSRKAELQADSLSYLYMKNANFDMSRVINVFSIFESAHELKYHSKIKLDSIFDFATYPFKGKWLIEDEVSLKSQDQSIGLINRDSTRSHPDFAIRKKALLNYVQLSAELEKSNEDKVNVMNEIGLLTDLEAINSYIHFNQLGTCFYYVLQLRTIRPEYIEYLDKTLAYLFVELYKSRKNHTFGIAVENVSNFGPEDSKGTIVFLNNLRISEIVNIGYHFLNNKNVFNQQYKDHYRLLWQICGYLRKTTIQEQLEKRYMAIFNKALRFDNNQ